jgi:pSer/pThr/pTyr-binding forkhead associated (FHA) protein
VSRRHAVLVRTVDDGYDVVDLGSTNGTFVNDADEPLAPNDPAPLAAGDELHVGAWTTIRLVEVES